MTQLAQIGLIVIFSFAFVFHAFVLMKIIPYAIVWGGRLKSDVAMYKFESVSLILNSIFLMLVLIKAGYLHIPLNEMTLTISFLTMAALFFVNTIGNLLSKNKLEKRVFTPLTFLSTIFTIVLALT